MPIRDFSRNKSQCARTMKMLSDLIVLHKESNKLVMTHPQQLAKTAITHYLLPVMATEALGRTLLKILRK